MKLCVRITQSDRGDFVATCPSLPGCVTRGGSREEAISQLDEAIRGYIAAVGDFVPERVEQYCVEA
jgi:predicted RNase H-like HicB family nuclease